VPVELARDHPLDVEIPPGTCLKNIPPRENPLHNSAHLRNT
jgi:hypothetical protein